MNLFNEYDIIKDIPHILLGNKSDLISEIDENLIDEFAKSNNIKYIKVSAQDNININESIEEIGKMLYQRKDHINNQNNIIISYKEKKNYRCILCKP